MNRAWLALAALALAGCAKNSGPGDVAQEFFKLIASGKAAQAYAGAAFGFRTAQSETFFEAALRESGLDAIASSKYDPPALSSDGRIARVGAEFTTKSKVVIPLVIALVHEDDAWRVLSLKSPRDPRSGSIDDRFTMIGRDPSWGDPTTVSPAPDLAASKALARQSLLLFSEAVQRKDFLQLFDEISLHWQDEIIMRQGPATIPGTMKRALTLTERQLGAGRLQHAFQSFIDEQVDLSAFKAMEPTLDGAPWVNTSGLLVVSGAYPIQPHAIRFSLKYYYEVPAWRLYGLDVRMEKPQ